MWGGKPETLWFWADDEGPNAGTSDALIATPPTVRQWIRSASASTAGSTSIKVDVLSAGVLAGSQLVWSGGTRATLSAQANAGDSTVYVTALPGAVAAGETAVGSINVVQLRQVNVTMAAPSISTRGRPT